MCHPNATIQVPWRDVFGVAEVAVDREQVDGARRSGATQARLHPRLELGGERPQAVVAGEGHVAQPGEVPEQGQGLDVVAEVARGQDVIRGLVVEDGDGDRSPRNRDRPLGEPAFDQLPRPAPPVVEVEARAPAQLRDELTGACRLAEREEAAREVDEDARRQPVDRRRDRECAPARFVGPGGQRRVDRLHRDERREDVVVEALDQ